MLLFSFDELTDICMYLYVVVLDKNTPTAEKTLFGAQIGGRH